MRFALMVLVILVGCGESTQDGMGGSGGNDAPAFGVCCNDEGDAENGLDCCDEPGPDVNVNDGETLVIDGQIHNISVNRGVVLFTADACICGFFNLNSNGARVYVDEWADSEPLQAAEDANVNANAYLYVQSGGFRVGNNFANNSGGATLLEGDLDVAMNLYLNSAALMCTMEGELTANPVVDNGGDLLLVGTPTFDEDLDETFTGDLDDVAQMLITRLDDDFPDQTDGTTYRVRFDYSADTLDRPIRLPMLFESLAGRWSEVGR